MPDIINTICENFEDYGVFQGDGDLCGHFVKLNINFVIKNGIPYPSFRPMIGRVVGMGSGGVIVATEIGFIGWVEPSNYEVVNFVLPVSDYIH